jgi:pimeloyl-ACP methyl ester carboxylesterase
MTPDNPVSYQEIMQVIRTRCHHCLKMLDNECVGNVTLNTSKTDLIFEKDIFHIHGLHVVRFSRTTNKPALIFIHGGPGYNNSITEYLIEHHRLFESLEYDLILFDQRTCGRSKDFPEHPNHTDNINDLKKLCGSLQEQNIPLTGFIGHSYGAKLLFDFHQKHPLKNISKLFLK